MRNRWNHSLSLEKGSHAPTGVKDLSHGRAIRVTHGLEALVTDLQCSTAFGGMFVDRSDACDLRVWDDCPNKAAVHGNSHVAEVGRSGFKQLVQPVEQGAVCQKPSCKVIGHLGEPRAKRSSVEAILSHLVREGTRTVRQMDLAASLLRLWYR